MHWYGLVLKRGNGLPSSRDDGLPSRRAHRVWGCRRKRIFEKQIKEESMNVCLSREDSLCCSKWIVGVNPIATMLN